MQIEGIVQNDFKSWDIWRAQSVIRPTLDFSSSHHLRILGLIEFCRFLLNSIPELYLILFYFYHHYY